MEKGFNEKNNKREWQWLLICLLGAVLLEIFVFNFRHFQSMFYQERMLGSENIQLDGFVLQGDTLLSGEEGKSVLYLKDLDILLGGEELHNVYLDLEMPLAYERTDAASGICTLTPYIRDEGHDQYAQMAERIYRQDNTTAKYLWFQGTGKIQTVVLGCDFSEPGALRIRNIVVNARQPLGFSYMRCLVIFVILLFGAGLYTFWKQDEAAVADNKRKCLAVVAVGIVLILPAFCLYAANGYSKTDKHFQPYQQLAEALAVGQVHLLAEPTEQLKALENPYDYTARTAAGLVEGTDYLWDTAYYNGHYYTYFGIVPCLIFYLPAWILFGKHITEGIVVTVCAVLFYAGIWFLVREYCRKLYKEISFGIQLMMTATIFLGSNMMACLGNPDAHDVPRLVGIVFLGWGFGLWVSALPSGEKNAETKEKLILWRVSLGSVFMALSVGCRPNLSLYSFAALLLFWPYYRKTDDKKALQKGLAALLVPYVLPAVGLMYYNAIRFSSPFDFGFAYNLTVQDCSRNVISLDKVILGIYGYLLKLPQLDYRFPYLVPGTFAELNRLGHTTVYITYCYGGLLVCNLITWCIPMLFAKKNKGHSGIVMGQGLALVALVQLLVTALTGGISYNYMADFAFPILLAGWSGALLLWKRMQKTAGAKVLKGFLIINMIWSLWFHAQFYFVSTLEQGNTELYYRIFYAFNFF